MSRKNKNIIMCLVLVVLIFSLCFTVYNIKTNKSNVPNKMNFNGSERRMPSDDNIMERKRSRDKKSTTDDESKSSEKDESKSKNATNNDFIGEIKPPEIGEDEDFTPTDMPNAENIKKDFRGRNKNFNFSKSTNITTFQYVLIGVESLGISVVLIYLIMTNFNKKSLKDITSDKDNIIICILATIIITVGLVFGSKYVVKSMTSETQNIKVIDEKEFEQKSNDKSTENENQSTNDLKDNSSESA